MKENPGKSARKIRELCPFCFKTVDSLLTHQCDPMIEARSADFSFREDICTEEFLIYLYKKVGIWTSSGQIDHRKLNQQQYFTLFTKIYDRMDEMGDTPSLDLARQDKLYAVSPGKVTLETSPITDDADITAEEDDFYSQINRELTSHLPLICPFCYHPAKPLSTHRCNSMPSDFEFTPQIQEDAVLEELYRKTGGFTSKRTVDTMKLNRTLYQELFLLVNQSLKDSFEPSQQPSAKELEPSVEKTTDLDFVVDDQFGDMDILDIVAREIDIHGADLSIPSQPAISPTTAGESPKEGDPLCFNCRNMISCPLGKNSTEMELIFTCPQFAPMETGEKSSVSIPESGSKSSSVKTPAGVTASKSIDPKSLDADKQNLLAEIMEKWSEEQGKLKIYCKSCEMSMQKIVTTKKMFYRCSNFPECKIQADPWHIEQAIEKTVTSHKIHADVLVLYQYDDDKNTIYVSEIFSEGKIFT